MNTAQQKRFNSLYQQQLSALRRQGKAEQTIDAYSRAVRRVSEFFDQCPDKLTQQQLKDYFSALVNSHSWSTVKVDRNGLQFFYKQVLDKDWVWVDIVKPPQKKVLPAILTLREVERIINGTRELRYQQVGDPAHTAPLLRGAPGGIRPEPAGHSARDEARMSQNNGAVYPTDKNLVAELGMTAVLHTHTHTRRLDYHPHVHLIVPGGGVNRARREWRKLKGRYLFNGNALAAAFRGRMLSALERAGLQTRNTPQAWVVHCTKVGRGLPALKYLSRYLYRGVISDNNLLDDDGTYVTFQYRDSKTGEMKTRRERGEDFIALILQHTLPKGFRRTRDYGYLHGNAKALLKTVQWALQIAIPVWKKTPRPVFICKHCHSPMALVGFKARRRLSG